MKNAVFSKRMENVHNRIEVLMETEEEVKLQHVEALD